jgi:hypothetical protein
MLYIIYYLVIELCYIFFLYCDSYLKESQHMMIKRSINKNKSNYNYFIVNNDNTIN